MDFNYTDKMKMWIDNVQNPLVCADFKLFARFFINVRGPQHCETLDPVRQWNWTPHISACPFRGTNDLACGLIQHAVIKSF